MTAWIPANFTSFLYIYNNPPVGVRQIPLKVLIICTHCKKLPPGLADTPSVRDNQAQTYLRHWPITRPHANHFICGNKACSLLHYGHDTVQPPLPAWQDDLTMTEDNTLQKPVTLSVFLSPYEGQAHSEECSEWGGILLICKMPRMQQEKS